MLDKAFWVLFVDLCLWIANRLWHSWSFWLSAKLTPFFSWRYCQSVALNIVRLRHLTQFRPSLTSYHALKGAQIQIDSKRLWLFPAEMFRKRRRDHGCSGIHNQCDKLSILVFISDCFQERGAMVSHWSLLTYFRSVTHTWKPFMDHKIHPSGQPDLMKWLLVYDISTPSHH